MSIVAKVKFTDYGDSVARALDMIGAADKLPDKGLIIVKPNLTNADAPPVTTAVGAAEAVVLYCRQHCQAEVAIGEGSGSGETKDAFAANGYTALAAKYGIRLIDFNREEAVTRRHPEGRQLAQFHMPKVVQKAFVISAPVLKDHSFTVTTIAMKNMFGIAPAPFYEGTWNKSRLHSPSTHQSVVDVCLYKKPELCVVDASLALTGMHLSGRSKRLGVILTSFDPVAVDAVGSELLGHKAEDIEYLRTADGVLGNMRDVEIVEG